MSALVTEASVPKLPRGVRLKHDAARGGWVLLAPERVIACNETAVEVLKRIDGKTSVDAVVDDLVSRFGADRAIVSRDVCDVISQLAQKQLVQI